MGIDIVVAIIMVLAFIKGYRDGIIMSVFSIAGYIVGFFAAMHFSFVLANYLTANFNIAPQWIPILAFIVLFIAVIFIVRFIGKLIEKVMGKLLLTIFNRLAGSILWMAIGFILMSLLYGVLDQANLFTPDLKQASATLPYLKKCSFFVQENIGDVIPIIQNIYKEIDLYFESMAEQIV